MSAPRRPRTVRALLAVGVLALVAAHGIVLHGAASRVTSRLALPAAIVSGVMAMAAIKHLALLGSRHPWSRRRPRDRAGQR